MKSINRIMTVCTVLLVSLTIVSSLFILLTTEVQAKNTLAVNVSGPITTNTTWTKANSPYILTGEIIINEGVTLTIEPGVVVMGQTYSSLRAYGRLEAIGTPSQPITFTSVLSSTPGEWEGVSANEQGSAYLNHAVVQYGTFNIGVFSQDGAAITKIENTVTQFSDDIGMAMSDYSLHLVELDNVIFNNNDKNRVLIEAGPDSASLIGSTTLTAQPGLEGYEVYPVEQIGDFVVPSGITLTLEPGVTFFMPESSSIIVNGRLEAIGTPAQPITFTSTANSSPDEWYAIIIGVESDTGSAHLNHTVVQYGHLNIWINPEDGAPTTKIENTITQFGEDVGMLISDYSLHLVELDNVTFANNGKNRIEIYAEGDSASLIGNTTLTAQPGLEGYEVNLFNLWGNFEIPSSVTLTLEPGVTFFMPESSSIIVDGRLEAIGTPSQPITFTSIATNTHGWSGIFVDGGAIELTHAHIQRSKESGLSIMDGEVTAYCSTITDNPDSGVFVDEEAQANVLLAYNTIAGNNIAGLRHEGSGWIDARYNWWGAADGPSGIGSGSGDAVTGHTLYEPWLTEPGCQEVEPVNLEVAQIASANVITSGETVTYTITITNHAATTATQVTLTDILPADVTVLDVSVSCTGTTELVCDLGELAGGEQTAVTIQIRADVTETAVLTNTVEVLAQQPDMALDLNSSTLTTIVQPEAPRWQIFLPAILKQG